MDKYVYKNKINIGYNKFNLSKKEHNKLFKYRRRNWKSRYEYYYNDKEIIMEKYHSLVVKMICVLIFPIGVIWVGFPDALEELKTSIFQKKYGSFNVDDIYVKTELYSEIINLISKKKVQ